MNNQQAVIEKILSDANAAAEENIAAARVKADEIVSQARQAAQENARLHADDAKNAADELIRRRRSVDALESRKAELAAKKAVLDELFDEVVTTLRRDRAQLYRDNLARSIERAAEDGDQVVACAADAKIVTKKFVAEIAERCGKQIALSAQVGDFAGGVMLCGKNYDKNLTLDRQLQAVRERYEAQFSQMLFGDAN